MPSFRATVRIEGLQGDDAAEVRRALQMRLSKGEIDDCRILTVEPVDRRRQSAMRFAPRVAPAEGAWRKQSNAAGLILLLTLGWTVWVFWSFFSVYLAAD